ncbi:MAG: CCA tRNA nucleotidyltransferase [Nitrosopumilaceae archaeon]
MKHILDNARRIVIPSARLQQEKTKVANLALGLVREQTSKYQEIVDVEFGGSYSKGTWLPDKADIDIFIKFEKSISEEKFIELAKKIGFDSLKKFHPYVRYSDHPYVEAKIQRTKVNVVPCYDIEKGQWKSAADRSPFHTQFMLESLTSVMRDEVRLLKVFLKTVGIYGAEIAKQGFSGYVVEVLIWNYGTFENVIRAFTDLKPDQIIGNASKEFDTVVVIMDPIDDTRNLAAAISVENIGKFVLVCRSFLKKPSISFFKPKVNSKVSKENLESVLVVTFNFKPRSPDIIWGQIKRAANSLAIQMQIKDFNVLRKSAVTDEKTEAALLFLLQSTKITELYTREGPNFYSEVDSSMFITKNVKKSRIMWVNTNGRIHALQKRNQNDAQLFLQDLLKNHLNKTGIPKGLKSDLKKGFKIFPASKMTSKFIKEPLTELVTTDNAIFSST